MKDAPKDAIKDAYNNQQILEQFYPMTVDEILLESLLFNNLTSSTTFVAVSC